MLVRRRQRDQRDPAHFGHRQWPGIRRHLQPLRFTAGGDEVVSQGAGVGHPRRDGALDGVMNAPKRLVIGANAFTVA